MKDERRFHLRYRKQAAKKTADLTLAGRQILTMPLEWTISPACRTVEAVASGHVSLQEIERYLDDVMVSDALPYRKLFDASQAVSALVDGEMMLLGARLSAYTSLGPLGPLAIVAPATAIRQQAELFAALAPADRPLKIFKAVDAARKWLATAAKDVQT